MFSVPKHISPVPAPSDRSPPDLARECADDIAPALRDDLRAGLRDRHAARLDVDPHGVAEALDVDAMTGRNAAVAVAVSGTARRAHELFVFARARNDDADADDGIPRALAVVIDYLDGVLDEVVGNDDSFLPLDWEGRPWKHGGKDVVVFVRGEVRDYVAEEEAAKLLEEDAPPRAIPGFPAA
jgi:hypothetical protein